MNKYKRMNKYTVLYRYFNGEDTDYSYSQLEAASPWEAARVALWQHLDWAIGEEMYSRDVLGDMVDLDNALHDCEVVGVLEGYVNPYREGCSGKSALALFSDWDNLPLLVGRSKSLDRMIEKELGK